MKLDKVIEEEKLTELSLKHLAAAGAVAAAALTGGSTTGNPHYIDKSEHQSEVKRMSFKSFAAKVDARARTLATTITDKYAVGTDFAFKVAKLAIKHEKATFPKAEDILAVAGIESSFKPHAASKLAKDPAIGLMQVRPKVWGLDASKLKSSTEEQIAVGSKILHGYYQKLKSKEAALQAYNVGLTNYLKKKGLNPRYVPKFDDEREMYEGVSNPRQVVLTVQSMFLDAFNDFDTKLELIDEHTPLARYKLTILAPFSQLWFEIDQKEQAYQKITFGRYNPIGSSTDETCNFDTIADVLKFVKEKYNRFIKVKMLSNATIGLSGAKFNWNNYLLQ